MSRSAKWLLFFCALFSGSLYADQPKELREKGIYVVAEDQTIDGNYYAFGSSVEISGTVRGDAYVAASQIFIDGTVEGDLLLIGGSIDVTGDVKGNIRAIGGQVRLGGVVQHNVSLLAANAELSQSAKIGGSLVSVTGNEALGCWIGSDATVVSSNLRVSGKIKKDLRAYASQIRLTGKTEIGGNFAYRSNSPAWIDLHAKILGEVRYKTSVISDLLQNSWLHKLFIGTKLVAVFMNLFFTLAVGMILIKIFPHTLKETLHALNLHPWKSFFYGVVLLTILPIIALLLLLTILGAPFALTVVALNVITFYTAKIFSILWIADRFLPRIGLKANTLPLYLTGLILYFALTLIPYVGATLSFIALLFGVGGMVISQAKFLHIRAMKRAV